MIYSVRARQGRAAILGFGILCANIAVADPASTSKWHPWIEAGGMASTEDSRSETIIFAPLLQGERVLFFSHLRGQFSEGANAEGNAALGVRMMHSSGANVGAWVGFDQRRTRFDNAFNQISGGIEVLTPVFDFRANGYLPLNGRAHIASSTSQSVTRDSSTSISATAAALLLGTALTIETTTTQTRTDTTTTQTTDRALHEFALHGFDAEVGVRVPLHKLSLAAVIRGSRVLPELRFFGGGYWFGRNGVDPVAGPRVRAELRFDDVFAPLPGSRLTFESRYQFDTSRHHQLEAGLRLRVPFAGGGRQRRETVQAALTPQERRMTEALVRDPDVVTNTATVVETTLSSAVAVTEAVTRTSENVLDDATDVALNHVTFATDAAELAAAIAAGGNRLIIAQNAGGAINLTAAGGQVLQNDQTLQGGGSTISVRGATTGTVVPFTAPGAAPTLINTTNSPVVTAASNNHIHGVTIQGAGQGSGLGANSGILGQNGSSNVRVSQVTVSDVGGWGVRFQNNGSNLRILNSSVSNTGQAALSFDSDNDRITVSGNAVSNTLIHGLFFISNNTNVAVTGNSFSNTNNNGIEVNGAGNAITFANNSLSAIGNDAFDLDGNNVFTIAGNTISGNIGSDIFEFDSLPAATMQNSTGNVNATTAVGGLVCNTVTGGAGAFTGSISFADGTVLQDNVAPCN